MTDLPNIVLIGGAGSGKSTAAKWLRELGYLHLAFAGVADHPHPGSPRDWVQRAWGEQAINDREKLIAVANAARSVDPDVWLNSLLREFEQDLDTEGFNQPPVVVDDARFANEYFGLLGRGFVSVRVTAPDAQREQRLRGNGKWVDGYFDHEIEHYLDGVKPDHTIINDSTPDEFYNQLVIVLDRERKRR